VITLLWSIAVAILAHWTLTTLPEWAADLVIAVVVIACALAW
jgi:hypothetical protein